MSNLIEMPPHTYSAKLVEVQCGVSTFKLAGTLDGYIDFATPSGTYVMSLEEAAKLSAALNIVVSDVEKHCLYDRDPLLAEKENPDD